MSRTIVYYSGNKKVKLQVQGLFEGRQAARPRSAGADHSEGGVRFGMRPQAAGHEVAGLLRAQPASLTDSRFRSWSEADTMITAVDKGRTSVIPTDAVGCRRREVDRDQVAASAIRPGDFA